MADIAQTLLQTIHSPADLRPLSIDQLEQLAGQIREAIFNAVSTHGGHLASNLGVVELTLALHHVYDFGPHPHGPDKLLFDVGHQCYPHKMLTGRLSGFNKLRKAGGVGGFPMPEESDYDLFAVGHAGTAISTAVGIARGDQHNKQDSNVVAVVGDASIVNGMAFEGLNNAGTLKRQLLIVLNDNGMSISGPQGAFAEYLERVRVSTTYEEFKRLSRKLVEQMPGRVAHAIEDAWHSMKSGVKGVMWPGQFYEALGIKYMGPIDGHDLPGLVQFLAEIKHVDRPVLLHVKTKKGHGYEVATSDPTTMHSPASFTVNGCRVEIKKEGRSWTTAFADAAVAAANDNPQMVALTAAMPDGTGLSKYAAAHPDRYHDTGICESHLVAMAAGMAKRGLRPVAAIYSTFMQRCFDQVWQEVCLNRVPVVFAMDRAGYVGSDGAVHHGFLDLAFLRPMPGITLMAPADEADLNRMLRLGLTLSDASAIRYPRDNVPQCNFEDAVAPALAEQARAFELGRSRVLRTGGDATIISFGALATEAMLAAQQLAEQGVEVEVVDARFAKPLDGEMLSRVLRPGHVVMTLEDHAAQNGFGSAVIEHAVAAGLPTAGLTVLAHPDRLMAYDSRATQLRDACLDAAGMVEAIKTRMNSTEAVPLNL